MALLIDAVLFYLCLINCTVFVLMYVDKKKSKKKKWRISERKLLFLGMIGGGFGGLIGQKLFNHKTKKGRFYLFYIIGTVVDVLVLFYIYK